MWSSSRTSFQQRRDAGARRVVCREHERSAKVTLAFVYNSADWFVMDVVSLVGRLAAGLVLIPTNAFFVAIEFGLTRARQYSEEEFDEPGLHRAWKVTDDLEIYLTSCLVGITASSIAVGMDVEAKTQVD